MEEDSSREQQRKARKTNPSGAASTTKPDSRKPWLRYVLVFSSSSTINTFMLHMFALQNWLMTRQGRSLHGQHIVRR